METKDIIERLATLAIGGLAVELANRWRRRQQSREDLNQAISDLLELHFVLQSYVMTITAVQSRFNLPTEALPVLKKAVVAILPIDSEFNTRYNKAVDAVARYDPILGYRLRSRDLGQKFLGVIAQAQIQVPFGPLADFDLTFARESVTMLRDLIPELAKRVSWLLWRRVIQSLKRMNSEIPPEFEKLAEGIRGYFAANGITLPETKRSDAAPPKDAAS